MASAIDNMKRAIDTYQKRNKQYGDNYKHFGRLMMAMYPNGFKATTHYDWDRLGLIVMIASKLSRYVNDPHTGHIDSIHDMGVYSFMLEELDSLNCQTCGALLTDGKCLSCGAGTCLHEVGNAGFCKKCGKEFAYTAGWLKKKEDTILSNPCEHVYANKACIVCREPEPVHDCPSQRNKFLIAPANCRYHQWEEGICINCGTEYMKTQSRKEPQDHDCF